MSVIEKIKAKAAADLKHIVLAEGTEPRTVQAAQKIVAQKLAKVTLVGAKAEVEAKAAELGVDLTGVGVVDPAACEKTPAYAQKLFELRQKKGMTLEQATELVTKNTLYFATMMLKMDDADGTVAAVGDNFAGQCEVEDWSGIVSVAAGDSGTIGITDQGRALLAGTLPNDFYVAEDWPAVTVPEGR